MPRPSSLPRLSEIDPGALGAEIRAAAERLRPSNARAIAAQCVADLPADEI